MYVRAGRADCLYFEDFLYRCIGIAISDLQYSPTIHKSREEDIQISKQVNAI